MFWRGGCCFWTPTLQSIAFTTAGRENSHIERSTVAKIVDGSKDFVAVKAREPFYLTTSISCLEATGAMHTFLVAYREHPSPLEVDTRSKSVTPGLTGSLSHAPQDTSFSFSAQSFKTIADMPKELYHIGTRDYGIELFCDNLLIKDDVLFVVFSQEQFYGQL